MAHIKNAQSIEELVKTWNSDVKDLGLEIANVHRDVALCIGYIKACLESEKKEKKLVKAHA